VRVLELLGFPAKHISEQGQRSADQHGAEPGRSWGALFKHEFLKSASAKNSHSIPE
jgi:hypothetical protein